MSQPRGIVDIEKAADTVMQSYQEQPEIKSSSGLESLLQTYY